MHTGSFVKAVFGELETRGIRYGILRKVGEVENGEAHDIDVAVDFTKISTIEKIIYIIAEQYGWKKILYADKDCGNLKTIHYALMIGKRPEIVHFDLFRCFSWDGYIIFNNEKLLDGVEKKGSYYCVSRQLEITIKLLSRLIYHGYVKDEYKEDISIFANTEPKVFEETLNSVFENELVQNILNNCQKSNWEAIENSVQDVRKACSSKCRKSSFWTRSVCSLKRFFLPQGLMIAFLGTDGSGKSTIINGLPEYIGNTFDETQIKYFHWRPGFLKSPKGEKSGSKSNMEDPHKLKPYGKTISFAKFMYFNLDYILGYWIIVKKHLIKNELVVFDRYYYDYLLDKYRYRFDISDKMIDTMKYIIPKPDITFLLVGDADVLYERKKELPVEELKRQISTLKNCKDKIPNSHVIDVNQAVDLVLSDVSKIILNWMSRR